MDNVELWGKTRDYLEEQLDMLYDATGQTFPPELKACFLCAGYGAAVNAKEIEKDGEVDSAIAFAIDNLIGLGVNNKALEEYIICP